MTAAVEQPTHRTLICCLAPRYHTSIPSTLHKTQLQMELMSLKEEKVGDNLEAVVTGKEFLNRTLQAQALRTTINGIF